VSASRPCRPPQSSTSSSAAASSSSTSSSPTSLSPEGVHLLPPVLRGGFTPSSRPPRRVHLFPPVLRGGKLLLDPKLGSISLARGEFISLIWSSPLPVCRRQAPTASRVRRRTFFFNDKNDGTTVFSSIETRGVTGNGSQPASGSAATERGRM
jgi:hypothetical protein